MLTIPLCPRGAVHCYWSPPIIVVTVSLMLFSNAYAQVDKPDLRVLKPDNPAEGKEISGYPAAVALRANLPPTLTLNVSEIQLNISINGQSTAVSTMPVTSSWVLNSDMSSIDLVAYFESSLRALADGDGHFVPSDHVFGGINDQVLLAFVETSTHGTAGASRVLYQQPISGMNCRGSRTDLLRIQLRGISDLAAPHGEYHGILHLQLIAY